jgi:chromosome segregation ATPase
MHIKEVTLEGFKSYAGRTVVPGFDPLFNAITGLNGSGKSNILDSICFVLGITDLRQVRAASLQELVYKQGQAGVTKATVSIVFDNSDRSRSPLGYEDSPEITVTRQVTHPFAVFIISSGLLKRTLATACLSSFLCVCVCVGGGGGGGGLWCGGGGCFY